MMWTGLVAVISLLLSGVAFGAPAPLPRPVQIVEVAWAPQHGPHVRVTLSPGGRWKDSLGRKGEWERCVDHFVGLWLDGQRFVDLDLTARTVSDGQRVIARITILKGRLP